MTMALGGIPDVFTVIVIAAFLFLAVWVPCCTSDIVFPLLFTGGEPQGLDDSAESDTHA